MKLHQYRSDVIIPPTPFDYPSGDVLNPLQPLDQFMKAEVSVPVDHSLGSIIKCIEGEGKVTERSHTEEDSLWVGQPESLWYSC